MLGQRRNGRRLLYSPRYVDGYRVALLEAREDLHGLHFKHQCELADLRRELDKCRADLEELRAAVRARQNAEQELASLHRERAIQRARAQARDPTIPLH
jgi:Skp family chaperone for outer membrane proteins